MGVHLIDDEFQSDKYPTTPRGKVPLSVKDPTAQDLLWEYAQRRRAVDSEFSDDLETALRTAGYVPAPNTAGDDDADGEREKGELRLRVAELERWIGEVYAMLETVEFDTSKAYAQNKGRTARRLLRPLLRPDGTVKKG